jgi:hypothetical protein
MRLRQNHTQIPAGSVTIRRLGAADRESLERLAERDSSRAVALDDDVLGAEVEGALLAAISLASGKLIADPFSRTSELRAMLELRARQLRRRAIVHSAHRPAAALASSPPGAGGRLLTLLPRI